MRRLIATVVCLFSSSAAVGALPEPGSTYHILFATSQLMTITSSPSFPPDGGQFGNILAADWQVTFAAMNAGLPGTEAWNGLELKYHAILSTAASTIKARLIVDGPVYNTHGSRLATSKADMFDGNLERVLKFGIA